MFEVQYDESAAGRYLGGDDKPISPRTLQRMRQDGSGPAFIKVGRLVRYRQSDLDSWLADHRRFSTSDSVSEPAMTYVNLSSPIKRRRRTNSEILEIKDAKTTGVGRDDRDARSPNQDR